MKEYVKLSLTEKIWKEGNITVQKKLDEETLGETAFPRASPSLPFVDATA